MPESVQLVNVVGNGDLGRELDVDAVLEDIVRDSSITNANRTQQGITIKFVNQSGTISLYRSGKYSIMGSSSVEGLHRTNEIFLKVLEDYGIIANIGNDTVSVTNYVYSVDLGRDVNISQLDIWLGEEAEYEPEQFPYIIYHPSEINCTMTISASGKCVINTPNGEEAVKRAISTVKEKIEEIDVDN